MPVDAGGNGERSVIDKALLDRLGQIAYMADKVSVQDTEEAINRVLDELRSGIAWQPIDTAPKDGTRVLLFSRDSGQFVGRYGNGVWIVASFHDSVACASWVTHWKPLGPNPEAT